MVSTYVTPRDRGSKLKAVGDKYIGLSVDGSTHQNWTLCRGRAKLSPRLRCGCKGSGWRGTLLEDFLMKSLSQGSHSRTVDLKSVPLALGIDGSRALPAHGGPCNTWYHSGLLYIPKP